MEELTTLAGVYDPEGLYTICDEGICYEPIIKNTECSLSLIPFERKENESLKELKQRMTRSCNEGFEFYETSFEDLAAVLQQYSVYTPFMFLNGKRSKDNLRGRTKWIVLDIDNSAITDEEAHLLLADINHHIARTSDPDNAFKFRILIELDMQVDVPSENWKYFLESITNELGITADLLPKAQIYFSYNSNRVLSTLDAAPLEVKQHVINASQHKQPIKAATLPKKQKESALNDPRETFNYAFEATDGNGSRSLVQAGLHAIDLGADREYVENLIYSINNYWVVPMDEERLEKTVLAYLNRKLGGKNDKRKM